MINRKGILLGAGKNGSANLLASMATRHGIISGASGSGKTVCLKLLAEGFSSLGVPVFMTDVKGDLGSVVAPGKSTKASEERIKKCGLDPQAFAYRGFPTVFWDFFEDDGHPIRLSVNHIDPLLMAHLLDLNEVQTGIVEMAYRVSKKRGYELYDLYDLKDMVSYIGEHAVEFKLSDGLASLQSIGVIQRKIWEILDEGGHYFFGNPEINILDWLTIDSNGCGFINVLNAENLVKSTHLYSTLLLWILYELNRILPERGESEKPIFALLIDEAQMLFKYCTPKMLTKVEQLIRMMRSKGVAVIMQTWSPAEIPVPVVRQLHNRILMSMYAYTPLEQKGLMEISDTIPVNPGVDIYSELGSLGIGEAIVSLLDQDGVPGLGDRITLLPPQSRIGRLSDEGRKRISKADSLYGKYDDVIDYFSASEKLNPDEIIQKRGK